MNFRLLIFLFAWVFSISLVEARAETNSIGKSKWNYVAVESESFPFVAFDTLTLEINEQGFSALERSQTGGISGLGVDQVYTDWKMERTIFLKMNVKPNELKFSGKVIPFLDGFLYHDRKYDVPYAIYFTGFNRAEIIKLVKKIATQNAPSKFSILFDLLVPQTRAQARCLSRTSAYHLEESFRWPAFAQDMAACGLEGLKNAPTHLQNQARAAGSFFTDIKNDPKLIWSRVKKQFQASLDLILNVQAHFQNLAKTLTNIDFESLTAVACEVMKSTSQSLPLMLTGGGALKVSLLLAEKLKRVGSLGVHLNTLAGNPRALKAVVACE